MRAKLQEVKAELRRRWHRPIPEQGEWLGKVVSGYFAYHAVPYNTKAMRRFRNQVERHWRRHYAAGVNGTGQPGRICDGSPSNGSPNQGFCIPGLTSASTSGPEAGAQCVRSARWDLCGGWDEPQGEGPSLPRSIVAAGHGTDLLCLVRLGVRVRTSLRAAFGSAGGLRPGGSLPLSLRCSGCGCQGFWRERGDKHSPAPPPRGPRTGSRAGEGDPHPWPLSHTHSHPPGRGETQGW